MIAKWISRLYIVTPYERHPPKTDFQYLYPTHDMIRIEEVKKAVDFNIPDVLEAT